MDEIKVMPEEIVGCLSADMRDGRKIDAFLAACRQYLKQRRREQIESVREFYRSLDEDHARLTPCDCKLVLSNADEDVLTTMTAIVILVEVPLENSESA